MGQYSIWDKLYIKSIRTKNARTWANYLYMYDRNKDNDKALITFTSPKIKAHDKLEHIKHINPNYAIAKN